MRRAKLGLALILLTGAVACGGGGDDSSQNVGNDPADGGNNAGDTSPPPAPTPSPSPSPSPSPTPSPAPTPAGAVSLRTASQTAPLPNLLNQSFSCSPSNGAFSLVLDSNGQAQVAADGQAPIPGQYTISNNQIQITLVDGNAASSAAYLAIPDFVVGMRITNSSGESFACMARAHTLGDRSTTDEAIRCGRRNVSAESEDTFTLFTNGAAQWENVYEVPGGIDTTFQTRIGTYVLDQASGTVSMAYKDLGNDDILFFDANVSSAGVQMTQAPASGAGAETLTSGCRLLQ